MRCSGRQGELCTGKQCRLCPLRRKGGACRKERAVIPLSAAFDAPVDPRVQGGALLFRRIKDLDAERCSCRLEKMCVERARTAKDTEPTNPMRGGIGNPDGNQIENRHRNTRPQRGKKGVGGVAEKKQSICPARYQHFGGARERRQRIGRLRIKQMGRTVGGGGERRQQNVRIIPVVICIGHRKQGRKKVCADKRAASADDAKRQKTTSFSHFGTHG